MSLLNTKVDHKQMQISIQRSMTPLEDAFTNFMDLMKKQMASAVSQGEFTKVGKILACFACQNLTMTHITCNLKGLSSSKEEITEAFQKKILEAVNFCLAQMQQDIESDVTGSFHMFKN